MKLKENAVGLIISSCLLLSMGLFTGGIMFYALFAATAAILIGDFYLYASRLADLRRHLLVRKQLSVRDMATGTLATIDYKLDYSGSKTHLLHCTQPVDRSMSIFDPRRDISLQHGAEALEFAILPSKRGEFTMPGLEMSFESWLFHGTLTGGKADTVKVHTTPIGARGYDMGRASLRRFAIPGSESMKKGTGSDFSTVRAYMPGDSTRNIDWAISSRSGTLVVRDFEDLRTLPAFFLIDIDPSMDAGESETELDSAVRMAMALSSRVLQDNERVGLGCFSSTDLLLYRPLGGGKEQMSWLRQTFSTLKTAEGVQAVRRSMPAMQEMLTIWTDFADAQGLESISSIIDDAVHNFSVSVKQDGFMKAVLQTSQSGTVCHMIIITNMSMGIASLMSGTRIARYYGHNVTVVLTPHIWYQPRNAADPGKYFEQYYSIKDTMARLRSLGINVVELNAGETLEEMLLAARTRSSGIGR